MAKIKLMKSYHVSIEKPKLDIDSYRINLTTIVGVAKTHRIKLIFMTQQSTWNSTVDTLAKKWHWMRLRNGVLFKEDALDDALESLNDVIRNISNKHKIPLYDLANQIPKSLDYYYDDVHLNNKGSFETGVGLASFMMRNNLIH